MRYNDEFSKDANHQGSTKTVLKPGMKATLAPGTDSSPVPGPTPSSHRTSNVWDQSGTNAIKSSLAAARNPYQASRGAPTGPRATLPKSTLMMNVQTPSDMVTDLENLNINRTQNKDWKPNHTQYYDPSHGPTRSTMTTQWRNTNAASRAGSTRSFARQPYFSEYCRASNYTRRDFRLGDVITTPFHTSNTNPHVTPDDNCLTLTAVGPAYSKRRMMVVLFIHIQDLYCLPLYSFGNRGLKEKSDHLKKEYVCMANDGDEAFVNQGIHPPVIIQAHHPVLPNTTVHLTGGVRVRCNEDMHNAGRLTRDSYYELLGVWSELVNGARTEPWRQ